MLFISVASTKGMPTQIFPKLNFFNRSALKIKQSKPGCDFPIFAYNSDKEVVSACSEQILRLLITIASCPFNIYSFNTS